MKVWIEDSTLTNIANAIRDKNGSLDEYIPAQMSNAIMNISSGSGGYPEPTGTISITQNGVRIVKDYARADVNVPNSYAARDEGRVVSNGTLVAQTSKVVNVNGTYNTTTNDEVVVEVPESQPNLQSKTATENGTVSPDSGYDGLSSVVVAVPASQPNLQSKTATENGTVLPDTGYDGLSSVVVNVSGDNLTLVQKTITGNGTYDPVDDNADGYSSVIVNVEGGTPDGYTFSDGVLNIWEVADSAILTSKSITQNGSYSAANDNVDGYSQVNVNVQSDGNVPNPNFENTEEFIFFREVINEHEYILFQRIGTNGLTSISTFTDIPDGTKLTSEDLLTVEVYTDNYLNQRNMKIYTNGYSGSFEETRLLTSNGFRTYLRSDWDGGPTFTGAPKIMYFKFTKEASS